MEDEVFVDAEEEITPRRSGRKRRSTAGDTVAAVKKPKTKMATRHSPKAPRPQGGVTNPTPGVSRAPLGPDADADAFWKKMGGMLNGMETRLLRETDHVKEQLGVAVDAMGELEGRVERLSLIHI